MHKLLLLFPSLSHIYWKNLNLKNKKNVFCNKHYKPSSCTLRTNKDMITEILNKNLTSLINLKLSLYYSDKRWYFYFLNMFLSLYFKYFLNGLKNFSSIKQDYTCNVFRTIPSSGQPFDNFWFCFYHSYHNYYSW